MAGLQDSWKRYKSFLLVVIGLPTVVAAVLSAILPKQYVSVATAIPSNARLTDANRLAGNEVRELYPVFGESDDLDRIFEICKSATVSGQLSGRFHLATHYGFRPDKPEDEAKAQKRLVRSTEVLKTETGELKIKVWDRDPAIASAIANTYLVLTDSIQRSLVAALHGDALKALANTSPPDSLRSGISEIDPGTAAAAANRTLLAQRTVPPALLVLDAATPSLRPDRPDVLLNTVSAFLVSAFTAIAALLLFSPQRKTED